MSVKSVAINQQAQEIAQKVGVEQPTNKVGFVELIIPVIAALIPTLVEMFKSCTSNNPVASGPQKFVQHRYDDETEIYDSKLLRITRDEARKEAKKQGKKISKDEAELIAVKTLDQTRLAESNVVGACFRK